MEKGIEFGFEHYMEQIPEMGTVDPRASSPLVLAYIGDCVFDLIIKMMVAGRGNRQVHKLHEETSHYVQARNMQCTGEGETRAVSPRQKISRSQITGVLPVLRRSSGICT